MATNEKSQRATGGALPSWLYAAGLVALYVGERLVGNGPFRALSVLGAVLVLGAVVTRSLRVAHTTGDRKSAEGTLLAFVLVGIVSLVLYAVSSDLLLSFSQHTLDRSWPRVAGVLSVLWPVLMAFSVFPTMFVELAWSSVARAPKIEIVRIRDAAMTGVGLAGALTFALACGYVATQRDGKLDLSYFRTARPGEATRKIVQQLDAPLDVSIFYPPSSDVKEEVESYFQDLAKESPQIKITTYDNAVDISKAKELNVSANGIVVISRAGRKETLNIGVELDGARNQLRNLDKDVQKRLLQVARPGRTIYLTSGHGERGFDPANDTDKRPTLRDLREVLQGQSYAVRTLGLAEGLGVDIPADAAVVMIVGPTSEFLPEELAALERYLDKGGRLFVALDPDVRTDPTQPGGPPLLPELLGSLGLKFDPTPLANDQIFAQRSYQKSDRGNIATGGYSSHPAVASLSKLGMRAPMILVGAGHLEEVKVRPPNTTVDFTVRAQGQTFLDANRDFVDQPTEPRKTWELAAAVKRKIEAPKDDAAKDEDAKDAAAKKDVKTDDKKKKKKKKPSDEMRAVVLADVDALVDGVLANPGNAYFLLDGVKWLSGDESITGEVSSEVDVPILHTRKQDQVWFYACIFLVPAIVIGFGALMTRRRRMGVRSSATPPGTKTTKEAA